MRLGGGRAGSGTLKGRQKKGGGVLSFQSDACQALTKALVFRGGEVVCDTDWVAGGFGGVDELGGTQISSGDYFKEVCTVPRLHFNWYQTSDVCGCNQRLSTCNALTGPWTQLRFYSCRGASTREGEIIQRRGSRAASSKAF